MPIKNLSETVRLPRLGKIHLGYRHPEKGYPIKTEYFVFPKDHSDYKRLVELFGEKPKELRVLIPVEDDELWATQYYKAYSQTRGLVCKGDGMTAVRMVDAKTGEFPDKDTGMIDTKEMPCAGKECPEYKSKKCGEVMNLRFVLPEVPGLGVWQIDTGSINSILNINSCAALIKKAFGRISLIPLKLSLESTEVNNPETGKKQTVYVMHLRTHVTLAQLADAAREQAKVLALPVADLESEYERQVQENIDTLWSDGKPAPEPAPTTPPVPPEADINFDQPAPSKVDMVWLKEQLAILRDAKLKAWSNKAILEKLNAELKANYASPAEAIAHLSPEQAEQFCNAVREAVEMV